MIKEYLPDSQVGSRNIYHMLDYNIFNNFYIKTIIMSIQDEHAKAYLQKLTGLNTKNTQSATQFIQFTLEKVFSEIEGGSITISNEQKTQFHSGQLKRQKYQNQMEHLNKELAKNQEMYKLAKRQILKQKKSETEQEKLQNQAKKKAVQEKIQKWTEMQAELKQRREYLETVKKEKEIQEEERLRKEQEERLEFQKLEKKKSIEQRLRELEENKQKRQQALRNSLAQVKNLNPRYLEIERKFRQLEEQMRFEEQIAQKNHKLSLKIDHQAIKQHEKTFLSILHQRKSMEKSSNSPKSTHEAERQEKFNQFFSKDQEKIKLEKQKLKRRKQYQEKLKEIPVTIDEAKKVQVEIQKDKGKNKIKYNFLGQKALNDFQIYGEFQDFEINLDHKEIGKGYLKQLPAINQQSRVQKSRSLSTLHPEKLERTKYIDYLQQLKTQRTEKGYKTQDQIKGLLKSHKSKERAISELKQKIQQYDQEARRKQEEGRKPKGIRGEFEKIKQVDDIYLKSIRAKLTCLEMNV